MPHVEYDLAHEFEGQTPIQPGVICPSFAPRPLALVLGNQLLLRRDPAYPAEADRKYGIREYTVDAVAEVVAGLNLPMPEWMHATPPGVTTALGVFTGYLMLDAWVANQDRIIKTGVQSNTPASSCYHRLTIMVPRWLET